MMEAEFSIPLNKEDLLSNSGDSYNVKNIFEPACIDEKLADCNVDYRNEGAVAILKHFDTFYSVLHHFGRLKDEIKANTWEIIMSNVIVHINSLPMLLDPEGIDVQIRRQQLCTLKMECYILTQFMEAFESDASKPVITDSKKGKSSKKKSHENWDWNMERNRALIAINQLIQLEIQRLWDPPIVEEEFTNLFSGVCYKLLENQSFVRQKEDREIVFQIVGHLIKRFNHQLGASLKMIQLLQHFDYLVSPLAQALTLIVTEFGAKNLVGDMIREIGRMDSSELSRDTSGTRSFSQFIVEIADKIPAYVLPNISLLMSHLDGDSYTMRNGVLGVFGEIVIKVLSKEDLDENMKKSRESFLDRLEDHIHDVHAFVRSKDLQIWLHLCQEKAIPISRQGRIIDLVVGRLHDKSSQVRKYAVQFLKASLIGNPFAAKLPIEQLTSSLEKEIEKLKEMDPENNKPDKTLVSVNQKALDDWLKIENDLKAAILGHFASDKMDQTLEEVELYEDDEDALDKAVLQVHTYLNNKNYESAIKHILAALDTWKDCEDFQIESKDMDFILQTPEAEKSKEETLTEDVSTPDGNESKVDVMKKKCFVLLKKIFLLSNDAGDEDMELDLESATQIEQVETNPIVNSELEKQKVLVNYLQDCVRFAQQMRRAIPILCQLLGSKINSDVLETIDFFIASHEFGLAHSEEGIRRMANLIWSRDPIVKKAVVSAFERLYIDVASDGTRNNAAVIVKSLMSLITKANLGELTSLEELLCELMKMELIPQSVTQLLWQQFALKIPQTTLEDQIASITMLSMIAGAEKDIIKSNLSVLVEHGLTYTKSYVLARDTCSAILKLTKKSIKSGSSSDEPFRLPADHDLFSRLESLLVQGLTNIDDMSWTPFCEQALAVIYHLSEYPDVICGRIIKCLTETLMGSGNSDEPEEQAGENDEIFPTASQTTSTYKAHPRIVARVLSAAGHIALLQLYHLDVSIFGELKRRHRVKEEEKEKKGQKSTKTPNSRKSVRDSSASTVNSKMDTGADDDMGVGGAVAEDAEAEYIRKVCEHEIVTGQNLLSIFAPVAVLICSSQNKYKSVELQSAAALALSKFMLVSSEFCDQHLRLLFTILEKSELPAVRSNAIIALGDLTFRFPNLIEPWTPHLYARLRDDSVEVRKTTVTILTHLILNDMIKVKGQISEMAVCLEDKEEKIASSAKMFFFELAQKGNALYNIAPDVISRLSDPDSGVDEKTFRTIMKYLLQFIQKDKQAESLVEKLCHRFRATRTDRQWRDLSFCLSVLPYNEKAFKKLMENVRCYHDKLSDDEVFACFSNIISKSKKFAKIELKTLVEEFEATIQSFHTRGAEENADFDKAAKALSLAASQGNTKNATESGRRRKKTVTRQKKPKSWEVDDSDDDTDEQGKENKTPLPGRGKRKNTAKGRRAVTRLNPTFSSDDDDIFD